MLPCVAEAARIALGTMMIEVCVAVCCSVLQCVVLQYVAQAACFSPGTLMIEICVAVCCGVLQCVAVRCSVSLRYMLTMKLCKLRLV